MFLHVGICPLLRLETLLLPWDQLATVIDQLAWCRVDIHKPQMSQLRPEEFRTAENKKLLLF